MKEKRNKGFSMIELIIVIAVMAILIALVGGQLFPYIQKTKATRDYDTLDSIYKAYYTMIAELATEDDRSALTLDDDRFLEYLGIVGMSEMAGHIKSSQFKDASGNVTFGCFYEPQENDAIFGVYIVGQNGYPGIRIDNIGTKCQIGQQSEGAGRKYIEAESGLSKNLYAAGTNHDATK